MQTEKTDYLIIGAGIIGLTLALQLQEKGPGKKILLLEKEPDTARHSSGRNSGVLHAGFYSERGTRNLQGRILLELPGAALSGPNALSMPPGFTLIRSPGISAFQRITQ